MTNKIISLLLAIMLTASMIAVTAVSVSASMDNKGCYVPSKDDTNRYYFYLPSDWCNDKTNAAGVYWWAGTDACSAIDGSNPDSPAWPGYKAQPSDVKNIFYIDCPSDVGTIIWNNAFDGGEDKANPDYIKAVQTSNIGCEYYGAGDADAYSEEFFETMEASFNGDKTALGNFADNFFYDVSDSFSMNFDNMIFVADPTRVSVGEIGGKEQYLGEWYFYYGNGEYGTYPLRADAEANGTLYNTDYQPPKYGSDNEQSTTEVPAPVVPCLTVNATSNFFPEATETYNEETNEITVTYSLHSQKDILNTEWLLTYDPKVLALSSKTTVFNVSPAIGTGGSQYNLTEIPGEVYGVSSNLNLYDFSSEMKPYVNVVFDVLDISDLAPVNTTIDLNVKVLAVSKVGDDLQTNQDEEVILIRNGNIASDSQANSVLANVNTKTTLTESTFVSSSIPQGNETVNSTEATQSTFKTTATVAPNSSPDPTSAVGDNVVSTNDTANAGGNDTAVVQTGDSSLAIVVLALLIAATGVMFVIRKREMF